MDGVFGRAANMMGSSLDRDVKEPTGGGGWSGRGLGGEWLSVFVGTATATQVRSIISASWRGRMQASGLA